MDYAVGRIQAWGWAVLGVVGGLAIYVKFVAAFFVVGPAIAVALVVVGPMFQKPQVWIMAGLGVLPAGIYIYWGVVQQGFLGRQFSGRFIPSLLLSPVNYLEWAAMALAGQCVAIAAGVLELFLARQVLRRC